MIYHDLSFILGIKHHKTLKNPMEYSGNTCSSPMKKTRLSKTQVTFPVPVEPPTELLPKVRNIGWIHQVHKPRRNATLAAN